MKKYFCPFYLTGIVILLFSVKDASAQESNVVIDNNKIRVTAYTSQPGQEVCGKGKHTHGEHTTILLTDAKVRTINADGTVQTETYQADKHLYFVEKEGKVDKMPAGGAFWVEGATHSVTNTSDKPMRFYIIETKH